MPRPTIRILQEQRVRNQGEQHKILSQLEIASAMRKLKRERKLMRVLRRTMIIDEEILGKILAAKSVTLKPGTAEWQKAHEEMIGAFMEAERLDRDVEIERKKRKR